MAKRSYFFMAFAALALALAAFTWHVVAPIVEAQGSENTIEVTQVIAGDESLEVHWTYSGDESELSSWRIWYKENSEEGFYGIRK